MSEELTGRELDAAIAEELFGKKVSLDGKVPMLIGPGPQNRVLIPVKRYSSTWGGVGLIEQAMHERGMTLGLGRDRADGRWYAYFLPIPASTFAIGDTAPEAVARAALKALEVQA